MFAAPAPRDPPPLPSHTDILSPFIRTHLCSAPPPSLPSLSSLPDGVHKYQYNLTNIEYTEFDRLGITDEALAGAAGAAQLSVFPANTNVLYVGLDRAEAIVQDVSTSRREGRDTGV
jgi:hypothetical protein